MCVCGWESYFPHCFLAQNHHPQDLRAFLVISLKNCDACTQLQTIVGNAELPHLFPTPFFIPIFHPDVLLAAALDPPLQPAVE